MITVTTTAREGRSLHRALAYYDRPLIIYRRSNIRVLPVLVYCSWHGIALLFVCILSHWRRKKKKKKTKKNKKKKSDCGDVEDDDDKYATG